MQILLFGITCVGKTTIGQLLAKKLNFKFYDLDGEMRNEFNTTNEGFVGMFDLDKRDYLRSKKVSDILEKNDNVVVAITPISYFNHFRDIISKDSVLPIELTDTDEHIFDRIIFTDYNDNLLPDSEEYKLLHADYYMRQVEKDKTYYHYNYKQFNNEFFINGMSPEQAVAAIIKKYKLK